MSKFAILPAAAAAAFLVVGAGSAMASGHSDPDCGTLNSGWSWQKTVLPSTTTTDTTVGALTFSGNSGNANAEVTTTTTTTPGGIQCTALNSSSNVVPGHSHTIGGGVPIIEITSEVEKVCQNTGNKSSTSLVDGVDCENPRW